MFFDTSSNWMEADLDHFQYILYKVFMDEKRYNIEEIAARAGRHPDWIRKAIEGKRKASLYSMFKTLWHITGDDIFPRALLHGTGLHPENDDPGKYAQLSDLERQLSSISGIVKKLREEINGG